ncbi:MAG: PKD domain-containing protein, partial [Armatimonadetes bacterium]|nr:PKD domain-containing protein [Armatimonadota bacterium]
MRQGRVGWMLAWAACAGGLCAGPALAGLTVEIVQPETDPFTSQVDNPAFFAAVAYVDGQELPGGEVTWEWDFGDESAHSTDNPTTHVFETVGQFTVTVTATHAGQQGQDSATAIVEDRDPHPAGGTLSVYVAHDGTWMNHNSGEYEEAEIEDFVAVFTPPEQINDDPDVWIENQVNRPAVPAGWLFFEAASPMELHVVIRDTGNRLGEVIVVDRDTQTTVGSLEADVIGAEIDGRLAVAPESECFALNIKDTNGATIALAGADQQEADDAVALMHVYAWDANRGDQHDGCPAERTAPWGNPADCSGRKSLPTGPGGETMPVPVTVCCGRNEFVNDSPDEGDERPKYKLHPT